MNVDRQGWAELLRLLETALELQEPAREPWLQGLPAPQQASLRELLEQRRALETADFLARPAAWPADAAPAAGASAGQRVGPWRLLRELGSGGMAWVWLAERADGGLQRRVALKLPRLGWAPGLAERMGRERDILARLEHPNIARLYDAGIDDQGRPWLALEHVRGLPIDRHARERGLDVPARAALLQQAAQAVAHAHSQQVLHRDLKPSNIFVSETGSVQLLDFGIARLMLDDGAEGTALTVAGGRALTPEYASPEQVMRQPLTQASDIYSLAVVGYELLSGTRPYRVRRGSAAELEEAVLNADIAAPSRMATQPADRRALRGDLDAVLLKALKRVPAERYASAQDLADDIGRALRREPVQAQPDSAVYRVRQWVRRRPLESALVAALAVAIPAGAAAQVAVMLALGVGAAATLWQARKAREQARRAQAQAERAEQVKRLALSLFEAADLTHGATAHTTVPDLLRAAAARLDAQPHLDALTVAELRLVLGVSLANLGLLEDYLRLARQALATTERLGAAAGPLHASALIAVGEVLPPLGQLDEGETLLRRAMAMPLTPAQAVAVRIELAKTLHLSGRAVEGLPHIHEACTIADRQLAAEGEGALPSAATAYKFLAYTLKMSDQPGRLVAAQRALELAQRAAGDRHSVPAAEAAVAEADARVHEGDALAGLAQLAAAVDTLQGLVPADNESAVSSLNWLMNAQDACGDVHAALATQRGLLARMAGARTRFGAFNQHHLGRLLLKTWRLDEALAALGTSVEIATETMPGTPNAAAFACWLASAWLAAGQPARAQAVLDAVPDADLALSRPEIRTTCAEMCAARGDSAAALAHARALMPLLLGPATMRHSHLMLRCAEVALQAGDAPLALAWAEQLRGHLARGQLDSSPVLADSFWLTARAQAEIGRHDEAAAAALQAQSRWRLFDPAHPRIEQIQAARGGFGLVLP